LLTLKLKPTGQIRELVLELEYELAVTYNIECSLLFGALTVGVVLGKFYWAKLLRTWVWPTILLLAHGYSVHFATMTKELLIRLLAVIWLL